MYASAADIRRDVSQLLRPPKRVKVSDIAAEHVKVRTASGGVGSWDPDVTPYMVEPMNELTSRHYDSVIFVGPAQSGKTQALVDSWIGYVVIADPSDMMVLQTSKDTAADYSKRRVNRLHRNSPEIAKHMVGRQGDNVHEKIYREGNILNIGWPAISQLSGRAIKYMALTDYDRMPEDIEKEGSPYLLSKKRTTTFLSKGMTLVDTSPGYEVLDPKWRPRTPHEAPPTRGALSLYNLGDRRRWYFRCPSCDEYFMQAPGIEGFSFTYNRDLFGVTDTTIIGEVGVPCTHCGAIAQESDKPAMNRTGLWVPEGCHIVDGAVTGTPRETRIASFWLPGAAAAYQSWRAIVQAFLNAQREYDISGVEESLKTVTNVDLGAPYLPRRLQSDTNAGDIEKRAEDLPKRAVLAGVRYLLAVVDVQKHCFVVQITGHGVNDERWLIDRFEIYNSARMSGGETLPIDPAGYIEDWNVITERVLKASYPLADDSGRKMAILATGGDSGGRAGVTENAYNYWRALRKKGMHQCFYLLKGERPKPQTRRPLINKSYPDNTSRTARKADARGEIPLWLVNTTLTKDAVIADLKRAEPGPRYIHFPDWLGNAFYEELTAEVRTDKGWENPTRSKNEAFDLLSYDTALKKAILAESRLQQIDWNNPPSWARDWDQNPLVIQGSGTRFDQISATRTGRRVISGGIDR